MTDNAKKKGLHGQKRYYYIFSIGTEPEHRGKGRLGLLLFGLGSGWLTRLQGWQKLSCSNTSIPPGVKTSLFGSRLRVQALAIFICHWDFKRLRRLSLGKARSLRMLQDSQAALGFQSMRWYGGLSSRSLRRCDSTLLCTCASIIYPYEW